MCSIRGAIWALEVQGERNRTHRVYDYLQNNGIAGEMIDNLYVTFFLGGEILTESYRYVDEVQDNLLIDTLGTIIRF